MNMDFVMPSCTVFVVTFFFFIKCLVFSIDLICFIKKILIICLDFGFFASR